MTKRIVRTKRKNMITNEQCKEIFDVSFRPIIGYRDAIGDLNSVTRMPETTVVRLKDGTLAVGLGCSMVEMMKTVEIEEILFHQSFFVNQARGMIMAKADKHGGWTNTKLLEEFTRGMKQKIAG